MDDPYTVLGVDKKASKDTIKKTYRKKAKKVHPDSGGSAEEFSKLSKAYQILITDSKRAYYDRTGEEKTDNPDAMTNIAISTLCSLFMNALNQNGPDVDLIQIVKAELYKGENTLKNNIKVFQKDINALQLVEKKIIYKAKNSKNNFLLKSITDKIQVFNAQIEDAEFQINTIDIAKRLIDDYKYLRRNDEFLFSQMISHFDLGQTRDTDTKFIW